jgi:hypothetical protein
MRCTPLHQSILETQAVIFFPVHICDNLEKINVNVLSDLKGQFLWGPTKAEASLLAAAKPVRFTLPQKEIFPSCHPSSTSQDRFTLRKLLSKITVPGIFLVPGTFIVDLTETMHTV